MSLNNRRTSQEFQHHFEDIIGIPFTHNNAIKVLKNGDEIFPRMLNAIEKASQKIDLVTYVYWTGDIAEKFSQALASKAQQQVKVSVLLDGYGAQRIEQNLLQLMEKAGVVIRWFRPIRLLHIAKLDNRTHRKILIVDDKVGFTGGVGIATEWEGDARNSDEWRDTHFEITGPAVSGLRGAFIANWAETGDYSVLNINHCPRPALDGTALIQVIRSTTSAGWSDIVTLFHTLINTATASLKISTAYFVVDQQLLDTFKAAVNRGVSIDIIIPGEHIDKELSLLAGQNYFDELIQMGIHIYAYQPTMLHTKIILVDDTLACIGSPNFNQRSKAKDEEIALCVIDKPLLTTLSQQFSDDLTQSERYNLENWQNRSWCLKLRQWLALQLKSQL